MRKGTEDGGQRTEDRGRRTEDRGQRSEDRGRRTEDRGQRSEDGGQESGLHPSRWLSRLYPEGISAISRWLSVATPPVAMISVFASRRDASNVLWRRLCSESSVNREYGDNPAAGEYSTVNRRSEAETGEANECPMSRGKGRERGNMASNQNALNPLMLEGRDVIDCDMNKCGNK
jgi:hypothetical protein